MSKVLRSVVSIITILTYTLLLASPVSSAGNCSIFRNWNTGDSLSASDLTTSFTTVGVTNDSLTCIDDYSATAAQMRTTTDPYASGTESLATSGAGEFERVRFVLKHLTSWAYWYSHNEDINFGHRMVRQHQTLVTDYRPMFRGEQTWSAAAVRFHGVTFSVVDGASHPESVLALFHVGGRTALALTKGGDLHISGSMAVTAGTVQHPSYTFVADHQTGIFSAGQNVVAVGIGRNEVARFHGYGMLLAPHAAVSFRPAAGAAAGHVTGLSLASGDVVMVGDATRPLLFRSAAITAAGNRFFGYNSGGTGVESKEIITGDNLTITHATGSIRFDVLSTYTHTAAQTVGDRRMAAGGAFYPVAHIIGAYHVNAIYATSIIKAWIHFDGGTPGIQDSFGVSSLTKTATGDYTVVWANNFSNAHYAVGGFARSLASNRIGFLGTNNGGFLVGSFRFTTVQDSTLVDCRECSVIAVGRQ